jgi:hypothetical protein
VRVEKSLAPQPSLIVDGLKTLPTKTWPRATHAGGTVIASLAIVTVLPAARALPSRVVAPPIVILFPAPAGSRIFPTKEAFAPIVVAPLGAQNTSEAQAPSAKVTMELAAGLSAPPDLKM